MAKRMIAQSTSQLVRCLLLFTFLATGTQANDFRLADIDGHSFSFTDQPQETKILLVSLEKDSFKKSQIEKLKKFLNKLTLGEYKLYIISASLPEGNQNDFEGLKEFNVLYDNSLAVSLNFQFRRAFDYRILNLKSLEVAEEGNLTKLNSKGPLWHLTQGTLGLPCPPLKFAKSKKQNDNFKTTILPALDKTCLNCHAKIDGLTFFDDIESIQGWSATMLNNIRLGYMPASFIHNKQHELINHYTNNDLQTVTSWLNKGAPTQKKDLVFYKNFYQQKKQSKIKALDLLPKPDLILEAEEEVTIPAESPPLVKSFQFKINLEKEQFIDKVFLSVNGQTCHHMNLFTSTKPLLQKGPYLENEDVKIKRVRASFGTERRSASIFEKTYQVAEASRISGLLPEYPCDGNTCFRSVIPQTGYLTIENHYTATGKIEKDKPKLLIFFKKDYLDKTKKMEKLALMLGKFTMPPNTGATPLIIEHTFDRDTLLLGYTLQAHYRGRSSKLMIKRKDASVYETIFSNPHFQYKLQYYGFLKKPVKINKGDAIVSEVVYDNSINNEFVLNPNATVGLGEGLVDQEAHVVTIFHSSLEDK